MSSCHQLLQQFLINSEELCESLSKVKSNMEKNNPQQIEIIQQLIEKRQTTIDKLEDLTKQPSFEWSPEDRSILTKLQELEQTIQPRMNELYQSFQHQITRFNQTKQVSKKYIGAYQNMMTDGSFIDKRK